VRGEFGQKAHAREILRRVDARGRRAVGDIDDDPVTVMERAQLLEETCDALVLRTLRGALLVVPHKVGAELPAGCPAAPVIAERKAAAPVVAAASAAAGAAPPASAAASGAGA